ncbi:MAG: prepilin-type N-terminal cleavage/methylation domain-containing protein [Eubacteriaceae bacterium]|nr:prepilin-type N-terminal cleavage/methylation domain-containing protein [Eubacteriaceae bacterium]
MNNKRGFTLVEVIVVLVIIAILISISIPVFAGIFTRARETACAANRRTLQTVLTMEFAIGGGGAVEEYYQSSEGKNVCPSGGVVTYELKNGEVKIKCSIHALEEGIEFNPKDNFNAALEKNIVVLNSGQRIDSNSVTGDKAKAIRKELIAAGADLDKIGIKTWALVNSKDKGVEYVWTDYEITKKITVPVICYNKTEQKYYVGYSNAQERNDYFIIAPNAENKGYGSDKSNQISKSFDTYEEAVKAYEKLRPKK